MEQEERTEQMISEQLLNPLLDCDPIDISPLNACTSSSTLLNDDELLCVSEDQPAPDQDQQLELQLDIPGKIKRNKFSYLSKRGPGRPRKDVQGFFYKKAVRTQLKRKNFNRSMLVKRYLNDEHMQTGRFLAHNHPSPSDADGSESLQSLSESTTFNHKYEGKLCCLCNLSEQSQLGQGELIRFESSLPMDMFGENVTSHPVTELDTLKIKINLTNQTVSKDVSSFKSVINHHTDDINELDVIGHRDQLNLRNLQDSNYFYIHKMCALWSQGIVCDNDGQLKNVDVIAAQSLKIQCSFCQHYGASLSCKMNCSKMYHFPCATAAGCFLIVSSFVTFCTDHLYQIPINYTDGNVSCQTCNLMGDPSKHVMCSICGDHYHTACIGLKDTPGTRAGWQCTSCIRCQVCKQTDVLDERLITCEQCHKVYHSNCLRPIVASVPKLGWKCRNCRICSDCGSRTPGAGASSRWHSNYTVCDSCYQQRNKGFSCPICHKAYRAAAHKEMVKCCSCNRFVHNTCDAEADLSVYHLRKETNPDYDYICTLCKKISYKGEGMLAGLQNFDGSDGNSLEKTFAAPLRGRSLETILKLPKKRMRLKDMYRGKGKYMQKKSQMGEISGGKKQRVSKGKGRGMGGFYEAPTSPPADRLGVRNDESGIDKKIVICSANDQFILSQDICVMCGAIGADDERELICCAQCGQCYHPYCVNVQLNKVILTRGWRCLDCTICEGCGKKDDDALLILCDECDISYHTYCHDPPLDSVPHGNWKCKWCAVCHSCGRKEPGKNSQWKNSYSECGPCASQTSCAVCSVTYEMGEIIMQCTTCERWLHCKCDSINSEDEVKRCDLSKYVCKLCRPKDAVPFYLKNQAPSTSSAAIKSAASSISHDNNSIDELLPENGLGYTLPTTSTMKNAPMELAHHMDGVYVSEQGLQLIKSLQTEIKKKRKFRGANAIDEQVNKDSAILAAIESVVAGTSNDNSWEDNRLEAAIDEPINTYKDGMVWHGDTISPPMGFSFFTNDQGVTVLKKKRQRNLLKLGIGGFSVKNRAVRKDTTIDLLEENDDTTQQLELEKEKKKRAPVRKKPKTKLNELYPSYLQEAFFGKSLHETTEKLSLSESESSEDDNRLGSAEGSGIVLSTDEINYLKSFQEKIAQPAKPKNGLPSATITSSNALPTPPSVQSNVIPFIATVPVQKPPMQNGPTTFTQPAAYGYNSVPEVMSKPVVSTIVKPPPPLPPPQQQQQQQITRDLEKMRSPIATNTFVPSSPIIHHNFQQNMMQQNPQQQQQPPQPQQQSVVTTPMMNNRDPVSIQLIPNGHAMGNQQQTNGYYHSEHMNNSSNSTDTVIMHETIVPKHIYAEPARPQQTLQHNNVHLSIKNAVPIAKKPNVQQLETLTVGGGGTGSSVGGTQKTAEKMRKDEELGKAATISAVLYANTQHPELKQQYPNWNDRCKQILKRWRSLPSDKKGPFLQKAKDNRAYVRVQKMQQNPEKNSYHHSKVTTTATTPTYNHNNNNNNTNHNNIPLSNIVTPRGAPPSYPLTVENRFNMNSTPHDDKNNCYRTTTSYLCGTDDKYSVPPNQTILPNSTSIRTSEEINSFNQEILRFDQEIKTIKENEQLKRLLQNPSSRVNMHVLDMNHLTDGGHKYNSDYTRNDHLDDLNMTLSDLNTIKSEEESFSSDRKSVVDDVNMEIFADTKLEASRQMACTISEALAERLTPMKIEADAVKAMMEPSVVAADCLADLDKLPSYDHAIEEVGDILKGIEDGDDDDDELLKSLTAEMGDDFNILEYGDPELDELSSDQSILNKLVFDDNDKNNE
ncbi:histone-lysine N-methyltransferase 2C isoform X2 [Episyrphus balteatus]|uniref:histone-lysine N-methyltransferase 2C isoform X2 n=1 Tax=Episyrphus balteatus TaxID=286459 RepID=UPI00248600DA|nr:histone-lysine N-methyltransferase 2C isoform X2 [Episyrphus balteatus]